MIEGADRDLLARSIAAAVAADSPDDALAALGWADALAADRRTAVSLLFEAQGAACSTSTSLDRVLATALGVDDGDVAVVLPGGIASTKVRSAGRALVAGVGGVAEVPASSLGIRPLGGMDPDLGLVAVTLTEPPSPSPSPGTAERWAEAEAAGRLALAHELLGLSRSMLEQARAHAVDRVQFGRPIASFQAVRHRLAEAHVAVEAADAALAAAWDDGSHLLALVAKAVAGRSARTVARHAQQVLAGIGFTTEHPLHRSVKRALVLDHLLGDARSLTRSLGEDLLRTRRLPALLPL